MVGQRVQQRGTRKRAGRLLSLSAHDMPPRNSRSRMSPPSLPEIDKNRNECGCKMQAHEGYRLSSSLDNHNPSTLRREWGYQSLRDRTCERVSSGSG
jgi:hypothetical protein